MLTVRISGTSGEVKKASSQVSALYTTGGKIVRRYSVDDYSRIVIEDGGVPFCDVLIIEENTDVKR